MRKMRRNGTSRARTRGHAVVEIALMSPWIFFLFIAICDFGFYAYAMIAVENAARVAAMHTSSDPALAADAGGACTYVLQEMKRLPNATSLSSCNASPLQVTAQKLSATGPDQEDATLVTVTYQTIAMIPLPFMTGQMTITRTVEAKL